MLRQTGKPNIDSMGVATGGAWGISVYIPPKSVYLTNFYVVRGTLTCFDFEIGMTS